MTIDQIFADVISKSCRIKNSNERADFQQLARQAYINDDLRKLRQYQRMVSQLPQTCMPAQPGIPTQVPRPVQVPSTMNPDGTFVTRRYDYFSDFNSPLNQQIPTMQKPYPLYANFGAYNKENI